MPTVIYSEESGFEIMLNSGVLVWVRPEVEDDAVRVVFEIPVGVTVIMGGRTPIPDTDLGEISVELRTQDKKRIM